MPYEHEEARNEYRRALADQGFDDFDDHEDGLDDDIDEFLSDLEGAPERIHILLQYVGQGYGVADAAYYAGYGQRSQGLHKVLKKDNGLPLKDKVKQFKEVHTDGKRRAEEARASLGG